MKKYKLHTSYKQILADTITPVSVYLKIRDKFPTACCWKAVTTVFPISAVILLQVLKFSRKTLSNPIRTEALQRKPFRKKPVYRKLFKLLPHSFKQKKMPLSLSTTVCLAI